MFGSFKTNQEFFYGRMCDQDNSFNVQVKLEKEEYYTNSVADYITYEKGGSSHGNISIVLKMEPEEEYPKDCNSSPVNHEDRGSCHGYTNSAVNEDDSSTEDCSYGEIYQLKTESDINEKEGCFHDIILNSKTVSRINKNDNGYYGNLYQIRSDSDVNNTVGIDEMGTCTSNIKTENYSDHIFDIDSNYQSRTLGYENHLDITEKQEIIKSKNRRKRKETVRRLKVKSLDAGHDESSFDIPLLLEVESGEDEAADENSECSNCGVIFYDNVKLKSHQKRCLATNKGRRSKKMMVDHKCGVCGKVFRDKRGLIRHGPVHSGVKPFQCHICERAYTQKGHLQQHLKMHNDGEETFECDYCYKVSQRKDKYLTHLNYHAKSKEAPYLCNACGSQFREKVELTKHVIMHRNTELYFIREFKTSSSDTAITVNDNVRRNDQDIFLMKKPIYSHLDSEDNCVAQNMSLGKEFDSFLYVCQLCKKEFSDWMNLQEHLCRHTGENFFLKCETCGNKFDKKVDFLKHQEGHAAESCLKCDVCGKFLLSNTDMVTHRNIHQVVSSPQRRNLKRSFDGNIKVVVQLMGENTGDADSLMESAQFSKDSFEGGNDECQQEENEKVFKKKMLINNKDMQLSQNTVMGPVESLSMFNHDFRYLHVENGAISQLQGSNERFHQSPSLSSQIDSNILESLDPQDSQDDTETNDKNSSPCHKKGKFFCNVCNSEFDKIRLLRLHACFCGNREEKVKVKIVGKRKEYECPICGKTFSDRRGIERHGPVHSGIKAYECSVCGRSYTQKGHLELHMKKHNDNYFERFECPFCFKIFEKKDRYVKHKEIHYTENPYTCNVCNGSVKSLEELHKHFKIQHSHHNFYYVENKSEIKNLDTTKKRVPEDLIPPPLQIFDSNKLQQLSDSQLLLKEQEQILFADGQFIYICQICRKQFQSWEVLLEHVDRHFGLSKQFKCETCDEEFDSVENLKLHINKHRENYDYMCQVCMKFFTVEDDLSNHFKIHNRLAQKRSFYIKHPKYHFVKPVIDMK